MWLISRTVACVTLFIAVIGLTLLIGRTQPVLQQLHAWRLDECVRPCWMGIVPGRSTVPEAYKQVATLLQSFGYTLDPLGPSWSNFGSVFLKIRDNKGHIYPNAIFTFVGQTKTLDELDVSVLPGEIEPAMPTFGEILNEFGSPTCLTFDQELNSPEFAMWYNDLNDKSIFGISINSRNFSWMQPIDGFSIVAPDYANGCLASGFIAVPWHGLKSSRQYIDDTQESIPNDNH